MINFKANVYGSLEIKKPLKVSVPKRIVENNNLFDKRILLTKFQKDEKYFIDVVPLQKINYKGYKWFNIYLPKDEAKAIGIKPKDTIKISFIHSKSKNEARISNALIEKHQDSINSIELFPEVIKTHQAYRKSTNPKILCFGYNKKNIFWWHSNGTPKPLALPDKVLLDDRLSLLSGGLRGEMGTSENVTIGEFSNVSFDFINFVLETLENKLEIKKELWKGRIEYRGPKWDTRLESKLKDFWHSTTGIESFFKSRFTKIKGKKSIPCGELMIHTGGILLKEALNGLVKSVENRILKRVDLAPLYIIGLLSAEGSLHIENNILKAISIFTKNNDHLDFYKHLFSNLGIDFITFKNRDCNVISINGWNNFFKIYLMTMKTSLTPFKFSLPYRDILFFQSLLNHGSTKILLSWDECLENKKIKLNDINELIKDKFNQYYSKSSTRMNFSNLLKNGYFRGKHEKHAYEVSITSKGVQARNAILNLFVCLENSSNRLNEFNSLLEKFNLGKVWIDDNMRIRTEWS